MISRILCVAPNPAIDRIEAVDRLIAGSVHRPELLICQPGGKPFNVARAARSLGRRALVVGVLGGYAGRWFARAATREGIDGRWTWTGGETRTCYAVLDRETGRFSEFYEPGIPLDEPVWDSLAADLSRALLAADVLVIAGSLPPGAPLDLAARWTAEANAAGVRVALDVSGENLREALAQKPWLVKINAAEASGVVDTTDPAGAAAALHAAGAATAIVTAGIKGSYLVSVQGRFRVGPPGEVGRFSIGSGDAFLAGFVSAAMHGASSQDSLRAAAAAGAANALIPGAGRLEISALGRLSDAAVIERLG
jgi:1-phosphofructokinase family hexose kinase